MPAEVASEWLRQTPFFTFPVHYDCYGNVLLQLSGAKRAVLTHRRYVKKTTSHEIFDVPRMFATGDGLPPRGWEKHVLTTVLRPGDGLFIPIGYFHTVAHGGQLPGLAAEDIGVGINFPAICPNRAYREVERTCEENFEKDFPHRQGEIAKGGDYKTGRIL